jgi:hypothetical protein
MLSEPGRSQKPRSGRRDRLIGEPPYDHGVLAPGVLAIILVTALLALIPARRLYLSGQSTMVVTAYFGVLWLLGVLIALGPGRSRLFVPLILVLYIVPFITWRAGLDRLLGRTPRPSTQPRNVTPPGEADRPNSPS